MARAKKKAEMERKAEDRRFAFELSEEELLERGDELAKCNIELRELEAERKEVLGKMKTRKEDLDTRAGKLERAVRSKSEDRKVECEWRVSETKDSTMVLRRTDNDEQVDERPMTDDERQLTM